MKFYSRRLHAVASYGLAICLIGYAVYWSWRHWDAIRADIEFETGSLFVLAPLIVASLLLMGLMNQLMASHLGAPLGFRQWASLSFASTMANYVLPLRAGAALRAGYYKHHSRLPLGYFASTMTVACVMTVLANALTACGIILWLASQPVKPGADAWVHDYQRLMLAVLSTVLIACTVGLLAAFNLHRFWPTLPRQGEASTRVADFLLRIHQGLMMMRDRPSVLVKAFLLSLAITLCYALRLQAAFAAVGRDVGVLECLLVGSLVSLSMFFTFTPAGIGTREAMVVIASMAIGVEGQVSLTASAVDRAVSMLLVVALGSGALLRISRESAVGNATSGTNHYLAKPTT
jgi:uncharacterized protein (TIRG00374 family)